MAVLTSFGVELTRSIEILRGSGQIFQLLRHLSGLFVRFSSEERRP